MTTTRRRKSLNGTDRPASNLNWIQRIRQQLSALPMEKPEESIPLRVLVQALVTIGILSTDFAAADVTDALGISVWAVPVSIAGAIWSWKQRYRRNIPVKFCIAIAMLLALASFFINLLSRNSDTRLVLAELLIQVQVLHSFDLPRRKDLGYSMVIGLILIGVAGTVSQTLVFAPFLFLFLAIALPVLILDYRSRLGLLTQTIRQIRVDLSPKRLVRFLAVTTCLGLLIFALLPRMPGYQLRTFPVSTPIDFNGAFNGRSILNPGYDSSDEATTGFGTGEGDGSSTGPGTLDDQFYYGFNTQINQNLRGIMEPQIVMRVRSQAKGFWRALAFDHYTGQGWEISRNDEADLQILTRPSWSYRFFVQLFGTSLGRTREVVQSYTIVSDLPNVIPAMYTPQEVYFPTQEIALDLEGGLRSPVPLSEGLTYTVVSEVPYRDRTKLRNTSTDYSKLIRDHYLDIPEAIAEPVRQLTEQVLAGAPAPLTAPSEKSLFLAQYLKQNYLILPDMPFLEEGQDLVDAFLFDFGGGYPDHFSTVLTMMLRSIGIPARLVVGFGPGEFNPFTGFYVVRNTDAYAMTEVYFPDEGWFAFDPIPGHEVIPPSFEDLQAFSVLRTFWEWIAGWLPSPVSGAFNYVFEKIGALISGAIALLSRIFAGGWIGWLLGLTLLTAVSFVGWLLWVGWKRWRYARWLSRLAPVEAVYQQMLAWLATQGFPKPASQTPFEYVRRSHPYSSPDHAAAIAAISDAYVRWRYGGYNADITQLHQHLRDLRKKAPRRQMRT
jgi:transglutaminase-like putative cysteine protease